MTSFVSPTIALLSQQEGVIPLKKLVKVPRSILSERDFSEDCPREDGENTFEDIASQCTLSFKTNGQRCFCVVYLGGSCDLFPFHLVDELDNAAQRVLMVLDCELLPLSHPTQSAHVANKDDKNLLVVFDVLCAESHSVRDRLRTLSEVLWDGHCKRCGRPHSLSDSLCGSPSLPYSVCDFGLRLSHPRFQRVVTKRCFSLDELRLHHLTVFRDEEQRLKNESRSECAKLYDGLILERDGDCFKFKRGALVTLDVAIPSRVREREGQAAIGHYEYRGGEGSALVERLCFLLSDCDTYVTTALPVFAPADLVPPGNADHLIVECEFRRASDRQSAWGRERLNRWEFVRVRTDKSRPNTVHHETRIAAQAQGPPMQAVVAAAKQSVAQRETERVSERERLTFAELCWSPEGAARNVVTEWRDRVSLYDSPRSLATTQGLHQTLPNLDGFERAARQFLVKCFSGDSLSSHVMHIVPRSAASSLEAFGLSHGDAVHFVERETLRLEPRPTAKAQVVVAHSLGDLCSSASALRSVLDSLRRDCLAREGLLIAFASLYPLTEALREVESQSYPYRPRDASPAPGHFVQRFDFRSPESTSWAGRISESYRGDYGLHRLEENLILDDPLPCDSEFRRIFADEGFVFKNALPLVQLGHLMPESLHFDEMCDDEVRLLQLRHCLVWECGVSPSFDDHSDYRPGALQRVQLDFETDGRIRFGPLASIGPSTDLIRYLLPFLDIRSHFLFAACSKSLLRMYLVGFESPVLQGVQSHKAITGFGDRGLFYVAESAKPMRFTAKYLDSFVLDALAKDAPCLLGCFYCHCQKSELADNSVEVNDEDDSHCTHHCLCLRCTIAAGRGEVDDGLVCQYRSGLNARMDGVDSTHIWDFHRCMCCDVSRQEFVHKVRPSFISVFVLKSLFLHDANLLPTVSRSEEGQHGERESDGVDDDWLVSLCPELFSVQDVWRDDDKLHRLHQLRLALDEVFYVPLIALQYLLPGAFNVANSFFNERFEEVHYYSVRDKEGLDLAIERWESVCREPMTWREKWIMLRTTRIFKGLHDGNSDRSYGDVTDCSPFATTMF